MNILIIGPGEHGKDELAKMLCTKLGCTSASSSEFACNRFIFDLMRDAHGYKSAEDCYADRRNHRMDWYHAILAYNNPPDRLAREILAEHDIYVGMRDDQEFEASRELFDQIIWIEAPLRVGGVDPSLKIPKEVADIVVNNDGLLIDLENAAEQIVARLFGLDDSDHWIDDDWLS